VRELHVEESPLAEQGFAILKNERAPFASGFRTGRDKREVVAVREEPFSHQPVSVPNVLRTHRKTTVFSE
jgi:hypothetical protein